MSGMRGELSPTTDERLRSALDAIDAAAARRLLEAAVAIPSPSGNEAPLAEFLVDTLRDRGLEARLQQLSGTQANVIAELPSSKGRARTHLLYGQLDTVFSGDAERDDRLTGGDRAPEFGTEPRNVGDWLLGVGAENPKGYLVAAITAFDALARARVPLRSNVILGLCAGGMPALPGVHHGKADVGFGIGCRALVADLGAIDAAVVPKPGFAVGHEEVGIAIYRIVVGGDLGYTGIRHHTAGVNALAAAAHVVDELEQWFPTYTTLFETDGTKPQGAVVAVTGGDPERPAFLPATCEIYIDLRIAPGRTITDVEKALDSRLEEAQARHGVALQRELLFGAPGAVTDPEQAVIRCAVTAWEQMTGLVHEPRRATSGYTDAVTLRLAGIPTARVGMPRPTADAADANRFSMGRVHVPSILTLAQWLVRTLILLDDESGGEPT
jgi:acetylornithine deacetylase/succinyl-diaminopimelate desuccinylase-like protein